ncbi:MAG: hypothetical protein IMF08_17780 [Proteobacteria bacterium]|nr:hypothetical protein [Pseudomonadota bacterium]
MTNEQRMKFIGRMAVTGGEAGVVGVMVAAFPILFVGSVFMGDAAIPVMLLGHGLLLGYYLARKLTRDAGFTTEQARVLRIAPPIALVIGFLAMDWYWGMIFDPLTSAMQGVMFGGIAGLIIGLAMLRLPLVAMGGRAAIVPAAMLVAGAIMGSLAGAMIAMPLLWMAAMPVWQAGVTAAMAGFLEVAAPQG